MFNFQYFQKLLFLCFFVFFSQKIQAQCCTYYLLSLDSYGDGWNGALLEVKVNNTTLGLYSASNYSSLDSFTLCNGDQVTFTYVAGDYENENSYQFYSANWLPVFSDGPNPSLGLVMDTTLPCSATVNIGNHPCNAFVLDTQSCIFLDNTLSVGSGISVDCANYNGSDVWVSLIVPPSGNLSLATDSGNINDTGLAAWRQNGACYNIQNLGCNDDNGVDYYSELNLSELIPGETLFVQLFGYGGVTGTFQFCQEDLGFITFDSSYLPIVLIETAGETIVSETKVNVQMEMKYNGLGEPTYLSDPANVYQGLIGIEYRGASSSGYPQKPFNIETRNNLGENNNVSLLGFPEENDWVLLSNFNDRSLVRNPLAYKLFEEMGNYSVKSSLCEVFIDSLYRGIYVLSEKIKIDNNRVAIATLQPTDNFGDEVTGGYILELNYWDNSNSFPSNFSPIDHPGLDVHYVFKDPSADELTSNQKTYIAQFIDTLETALYSTNFADTSLGYRKYLDTKSFIDYFIVNELARNNDGFKKSVYFHKDKNSNGGKFKAGPVWDFDWAWKNLPLCSNSFNTDGSGWAHLVNDCPQDNNSNGYYIRLLQDTTFANELRCTYETYRKTILDTTHIFAYIDSVEQIVELSVDRHFQKWPILGQSGPAPEPGPFAQTYADELDTLKSWIQTRLVWLDENMPGNCIVPVDTSTNIHDHEIANSFLVYPNPSSGWVNFEQTSKNNTVLQVKLFTILGELLDEFQFNNHQTKYLIKQPGIYFVSIYNENEVLLNEKIIIK
jgi:hypothetical protein